MVGWGIMQRKEKKKKRSVGYLRNTKSRRDTKGKIGEVSRGEAYAK